MDFTSILNDDKAYPDTAEITIGDQKVSLGDLRTLTRTQQKAVAEQMDTLTRERSEVKELATKTADLYTQLQAKEAAVAAAGPAKPDDFDDPWWAPVRGKLTPLQEEIKTLQTALKQQAAATERAATIWANDRWKAQYASQKDRLKSPKYADQTFEKVRDYAAQNKILDEYGLPALDLAIERMTAPDEMERIKQEAFERGMREGSVKARMNAMPRPSSAGGVNTEKVESLDPGKNFEDLGDSVASDPDLMKMLAGLNAIDPNEIM